MSASSSRSSSSLSHQVGIYDVDEQLRKNSERQVTVLHRYVCSGPLEGKFGEIVPKIQHEYLLLDVKLGSEEEFWIKAEKYASSGTLPGDRAGIHVTRPLNIRNELKSVQKHTSKRGEILMKDLIKTLTDHTANYQVVTQNCMDYARETYDKLVELLK
jgi:hypothetical protein